MRKFSPLILVVVLASATGLWGCSQQKTGAINAKIKELENRYDRLEEDFRTLQATNELNKKRLAQAESQRTALEQEKSELTRQLDGAILERENLRKQVGQRTQERDTAQANLIQFSKDLQALVGRVEAALNNTPQNPSASITPVSRRNE